MSSKKGKDTKAIITISFLISWVILVNIIVESEGNGLTNAEWLAGVVVTFGMLFLWVKVMNSTNDD